MSDVEKNAGGPDSEPVTDDAPTAGGGTSSVPEPVDFVEDSAESVADDDGGEWDDDDELAGDDDYDDDYDDGYASAGWVRLTTVLGAGLVGVVSAQVVLALVQGLSIKETQTDVLDRLGSPFGPPGSTLAVLMLVIGVALLSLPSFLGEARSAGEQSTFAVAITAVQALAVILALGSLLWVRAILNVRNATGQVTPAYLKVSYISFLIATVGLAVVAVWGALMARRLRQSWT